MKAGTVCSQLRNDGALNSEGQNERRLVAFKTSCRGPMCGEGYVGS